MTALINDVKNEYFLGLVITDSNLHTQSNEDSSETESSHLVHILIWMTCKKRIS